ncbi:MAG: VanZ family protein [Desulfosarcina sp.]|nr:VanZ family protein [Desulfobacterales bacterium]
MHPIATKGYLSRRGLIGINIALVLMTLFFGLRFEGATATNQVEWHPDRAGLRFGHYGMAYCLKAFETASSPASPAGTGLSFELAVRAEALKRDRFQILMMLHGGRDAEQLLIGQWRSSLIVMHGNDYSGRRRLKRLGVANALPAGIERLITVTSGPGGTRIFMDGQPVARTTSLTLKVPNRYAPVTLVVGNSVYARHSWNGDLYGLAIYRQALSPSTVAAHFDQWKKSRDFSLAVTSDPDILYLFNDVPGQKAFNRMGDTRYLIIPAGVQILKKEILRLPWDNARRRIGFVKDVFINFLGFIPLGFFLSALRADFGGGTARRNLILCVGLCFMLSLGIELAQAWIPSRSSQMLDLMLNTLGGAAGVALQRLHRNRRKEKNRSLAL